MRRLVSCHFGSDDLDSWTRLARVLEATARQNCTGWAIEVATMAPPTRRRATDSRQFLANTQKLDHWCRDVVEAADGDEILLIDADTMLLHPLDDVWQRPFDVAYTVRPAGSIYPFNAGVVFVRVSAPTRAFMSEWADLNRLMLRDRREHLPWHRIYGGFNQAALGRLLESGAHPLAYLQLPCAEWNCEDLTWSHFHRSTTRIVHLKGPLRAAALEDLQHAEPALRPLAQYWRDREAEVTAEARI